MSHPKKILFVDDDADLLEIIRHMAAQLAGESWIVSTAENVADAMGIIQEHQIDLIVLDLHMPVVDGVQFLGLLNRKHPNLQKVVLTSDISEEQRALCLSQGAELYLQKPRSSEEWRSVHRSLDELVQFKPQEGFRGVLRRVGLQDVLQMECLSRHSGLLEISTKTARGRIFIRGGQIIHAEVGERSGEDAFNYLMHLTGGEFAQKPYSDPPEQTIDHPWEFLLMEAARKRDESAEPSSTFEVNLAKPTPLPRLAPQETQFVPRPIVQQPVEPVPMRPEISEFLILSSQGDVIYNWQCPDITARVGFLEFISQKSRQLGQGLPFGPFQCFEIEGSKSRIVTQVENDHAMFVKANLVPTKTQEDI